MEPNPKINMTDLKDFLELLVFTKAPISKETLLIQWYLDLKNFPQPHISVTDYPGYTARNQEFQKRWKETYTKWAPKPINAATFLGKISKISLNDFLYLLSYAYFFFPLCNEEGNYFFNEDVSQQFIRSQFSLVNHLQFDLQLINGPNIGLTDFEAFVREMPLEHNGEGGEDEEDEEGEEGAEVELRTRCLKPSHSVIFFNILTAFLGSADIQHIFRNIKLPHPMEVHNTGYISSLKVLTTPSFVPSITPENKLFNNLLATLQALVEKVEVLEEQSKLQAKQLHAFLVAATAEENADEAAIAAALDAAGIRENPADDVPPAEDPENAENAENRNSDSAAGGSGRPLMFRGFSRDQENGPITGIVVEEADGSDSSRSSTPNSTH